MNVERTRFHMKDTPKQDSQALTAQEPEVTPDFVNLREKGEFSLESICFSRNIDYSHFDPWMF